MSPLSTTHVLQTATSVAAALRQYQMHVVFAESCTAGWCAALLSQIPGISEFLCGSAVTYRNATKTNWLNVAAADLAEPTIGPVSATVARQMALGVLTATPEAKLAISITGHLGPQAPPELDGVVFIGVAQRLAGKPTARSVTRYVLDPELSAGHTLRSQRQQAAVQLVFTTLLAALENTRTADSPSAAPASEE